MPLVSAGIAAGGSILGGLTGGKSAKSAAKIQARSYQQGINETAREFNQTQSNLQPFVAGGQSAEQQLLRALGLGDSNTGMSVNGQPAYSAADQQAGYLSGLKTNPLYTALMSSGTDALLQNASATGGLRGGNTQEALGQLGVDTLGTVYQSDLSNLFKLAQLGGNAGSSLGTLSGQNASSISNLLAKQGGASASGVLGAANATQNTINSLSSIAGQYFGKSGGGLGSDYSPYGWASDGSNLPPMRF